MLSYYLYKSEEETRRRFGDADKTGPLGLSMKLSVIKNGIKLIFVKKGHIVVPGLTGKTQPSLYTVHAMLIIENKTHTRMSWSKASR